MPDSDHEALGGARINGLRAILQQDAAIPFDVVLVHAGSTDVTANWQVASAPEWLSWLLSDLYHYRPQAEVFVAHLIPSLDAGINERIQAYNAALPAVVAQRVAKGQHVHLVDMYHAITLDDLADDLHPSPKGYAKMADVWFNAIASVLPPKSVSVFDLNLIASYWGQSNPGADFNRDGKVDIFDVNFLGRVPVAAGDYNGDGNVDIFDLNFLANYDANGDGRVDIFDLNYLAAGGASPSSIAPVSEPATLLLAAAAFVGLLGGIQSGRSDSSKASAA